MLVKYKSVCPVCNKSFTRQDHMKRHIYTVHSQEKWTSCPVCTKEYQRSDLEWHMNDCVPPDKKYHCRVCEFVSDTFLQLETHEVSHFTSVKHVCESCNAAFKRRDHLSRHVKSQHTSQVVSCSVCDQTFKRRDHMLRHMREKHHAIPRDYKVVKKKTATESSEKMPKIGPPPQ